MRFKIIKRLDYIMKQHDTLMDWLFLVVVVAVIQVLRSTPSRRPRHVELKLVGVVVSATSCCCRCFYHKCVTTTDLIFSGTVFLSVCDDANVSMVLRTNVSCRGILASVQQR